MTINNIPPHVSYDLGIFGSVAYGGAADSITLTGPGGLEQVQTDPIDGIDMTMIVPDLDGATSATFSVKATVPDEPGYDDRPWAIDSSTFSANLGDVGVGNSSPTVDVGGEEDIPVTYGGDGLSSISSVTLDVKNFDPDIIDPVDSTVTLYNVDTDTDPNDTYGHFAGELPVKGVAAGESPRVLQDAIGDEWSADVTAAAPTVVADGSDAEGVTYTSPNIPGFTFSVAQPSLTAVTVNFSTADSTLPSSMMGNLSGGSITIPATSDPSNPITSVFVPLMPADDGLVATRRSAVVVLASPGETLGEQEATPNEHDKVDVTNTDTPIPTFNGVENNAVIPLDPQGDNSDLTTIGLNDNAATTNGQTITETKLQWDPSEFTMWLTPQVGQAGTDLGSQTTAYHDPYNGLVTYAWYGAFHPKEVYGQDMDGSSEDDSTDVSLNVDDADAATPALEPQTGNAAKDADGTASGWLIYSNGSPITGALHRVIVGEEMELTAGYEGPFIPYASQFSWSIDGKVASGFSGGVTEDSNGISHSVSVLQSVNLRGNPDNGEVMFYWYGGDFQGEKEYISCTVNSPVVSGTAYTFFDVYRPKDSISVTPDSVHLITTGRLPELVYGVPVMINGEPHMRPPGIQFSVSATSLDPLGFAPGQYEWVQTLARTDVSWGPNTIKFFEYNGLDNTYPYDTGAETRDSPATVPDSTSDDFFAMMGKYSMYLLYKPAFSGSNWVPLRVVTWFANGEAKSQFGVWQAVSLQATDASNDHDADSLDYPTWNEVAINPADGIGDGNRNI